ncbi:hypothetical protein QSH18_13090 [Xanthomonas sp. NCPPB 2654]|uniref:hypothetical protein n=1 Tax=unclassified Xanthomonas TaxID=2643310 RepID=UPI0021E0F569|nr:MULTISPECIES: hypothetical protein [unclassified Xanthomonas]MDL5366536.1 hypothetical protein [Xanthomonas sp. NCPPB 2654]MDR6674257.1 hypothetical protein [Xanthomonas translucens]UYC21319.1 hypothetical protein NUG20_03180 [Xanthomonas sp. CFBP 8443]
MTSLHKCLPLLIAASLAACKPAATESAEAAPPANANAASPAVASAPPPIATEADFGEASLRPLLKPDDHILAFKNHDLTGDGQDDAVAIVRHATAAASGNTCELLVLQQTGKAWTVSDRSPQAVDCLYNDVARNATRLDDNLTLKPQEIVYINQQARSNVTYTLKYDTTKQAWYLAEASSAAPTENPKTGTMDVLRGTVRYPADLPWTPIAQIDPEQLQKAMDKHRAVIQ